MSEAHGLHFNLLAAAATKIFSRKEPEEKMEAKDQNIKRIKDERHFFTLIERKLERQGFEVIETLPPNKNTRNNIKNIFVHGFSDRLTY